MATEMEEARGLAARPSLIGSITLVPFTSRATRVHVEVTEDFYIYSVVVSKIKLQIASKVQPLAQYIKTCRTVTSLKQYNIEHGKT